MGTAALADPNFLPKEAVGKSDSELLLQQDRAGGRLFMYERMRMARLGRMRMLDEDMEEPFF